MLRTTLPSRPRAASWLRLAALAPLAVACSSGSSEPVDGGPDGLAGDARTDAPATCATDADCADGLFCNGAEVCDPSAPGADARGCAAAAAEPCEEAQTCDDAADLCVDACDTDADGDGRVALTCGGDDCDDADPDRYPGNPEVCDSEDHDEDCDPTTFGERDDDGDGYPDATCCNVDGTDRYCGTDCDDTFAAAHPDEAESCDGADNDCDGVVDDGVQRTFYEDADGDGYGDAGGAPVMACTPPEGHVENRTDCDDGDASIHPGAREVCDGTDRDCNGIVDDNPAADASCTAFHAVAVCRSGACVIESCDTLYKDCDFDPTNGCETYLSSADDCGNCDTPCFIAGTSAVCVGGECRPNGCTLGFADCDADPDCETDLTDTDSCGACGRVCAFPNAQAICPGTICTFDGCDPGYGSCDMDTGNGCETPLTTTSDCGACGTPCARDNAVATCATGTCAIDRCLPDHGDCDTSRANGCEVDLLSDERNCGACGVTCDGVCSNGACATVEGVAAGGLHSCAWLSDGTAWCWGQNDAGQLGDGTTTDRAVPVQVRGVPSTVVGIAVGGRHTCSFQSGTRIYCWGDNGFGQLGDGTMTDRPTPVWIDALRVKQVVAGADHTCALTTGDLVYCWGGNNYGQLGDGTTTRRPVPTPVNGDGGSAGNNLDLAAGAYHSCAVATVAEEDRVFCWGRNDHGQLGDGTTSQRTLPVAVSGSPTTTLDVAAGAGHTCALHGSGVSCWGHNDHGQLGNGTTTDRLTPGAVSGLTAGAAVQLSSGAAHSCVRKSGARVECWGENGFGAVGDGTTTDRPGRTTVSGISTATYVTAGSGYTCAALADGTARCWGSNTGGQLGDGTTTARLTPVPVAF